MCKPGVNTAILYGTTSNTQVPDPPKVPAHTTQHDTGQWFKHMVSFWNFHTAAASSLF